MRVAIRRPTRWTAEPIKLGRPGLSLLLIGVWAAVALLPFTTEGAPDSLRECALAADVATVVGGGPFFRDLEGEIIGQPRLNEPWAAHCLSTFEARGLTVLPPGVDLYSSTRLGTRFSRPFFYFNSNYASIDASPYGSNGRTKRVSVKRQGDHWVVVRICGMDSWPPRF
jgi:hypothetical protein